MGVEGVVSPFLIPCMSLDVSLLWEASLLISHVVLLLLAPVTEAFIMPSDVVLIDCVGRCAASLRRNTF